MTYSWLPQNLMNSPAVTGLMAHVTSKLAIGSCLHDAAKGLERLAAFGCQTFAVCPLASLARTDSPTKLTKILYNDIAFLLLASEKPSGSLLCSFNHTADTAQTF